MSRTRVHKPLKFVVPAKDVELRDGKYPVINNWRPDYNKFFGRFRSAKFFAKINRHQKRQRDRADLLEMLRDPDAYDDYASRPDHYDKQW